MLLYVLVCCVLLFVVVCCRALLRVVCLALLFDLGVVLLFGCCVL